MRCTSRSPADPSVCIRAPSATRQPRRSRSHERSSGSTRSRFNRCGRRSSKVGRYRAMAVHRVRAGVDAGGRLTAWHQQIVAEPTSVNLPFVRDVMFTKGVDFFTTTGAVDPPYAVENFRLESTNFESRIPTMVGGRSATHTRSSHASRRLTSSRSRPVVIRSSSGESCWRTTPGRCGRSSSPPSAPTGGRRCPKAGHAESRAPASSVTAPR